MSANHHHVLKTARSIVTVDITPDIQSLHVDTGKAGGRVKFNIVNGELHLEILSNERVLFSGQMDLLESDFELCSALKEAKGNVSVVATANPDSDAVNALLYFFQN